MPGGLLNIISYGNQNIILNGNPSKTFFKTVYAKYSNFGLQNIRLDYNGQKHLHLNEDSAFTFKIPRNAELLLDTFLVFTLPDIWSPIVPPGIFPNHPGAVDDVWKPYEFRWIENIGTNIIKKVTLSIGGQVIQSYSGQHIKNMVERDLDHNKLALFNKMIGMTNELNRPENANNRFNNYPNVFYIPNQPGEINVGRDPSIRGRKIYVPLNFWFSFSSKMALPLVALQYSDVTIDFILRPIVDLYTINDVSLTLPNGFTNSPVKPSVNNEYHSFYRFIQQPPTEWVLAEDYANKAYLWNTDIHIIATYCFLSEEESLVFAKNEQKYLIKDVKEEVITNVTGTRRVKLLSTGMASTWMWYFQRDDINLRNEWSNFTNWPYKNTLPYDIIPAPTTSNNVFVYNGNIGPGVNFKKIINSYIEQSSLLNITNTNTSKNKKNIMESMAILFDGKYRENDLDAGIYNYIEKYKMSKGDSDDGIYFYNYCLHTDPYDLQPSGAINLSKFKTIEIEFVTNKPPFDASSEYFTVCDQNGAVIGTTKNLNLYEYSYNLTFVEERYNIVRFVSGQAGLLYAR
jgi:hypothetical protein